MNKSMLVILLLFGIFLALKPMTLYASGDQKDSEPPSEDWEAMYNDMVARYDVLKADYDSLLWNYTKLKSDYDALMTDYEFLNASYHNTWTDYGVLKMNYTLLKSDYDDLETDYDKIRMEYLRLNSSYYALMSGYDSLNASYLHLSEDYNALRIEFDNTVVALEKLREESGRNALMMYSLGFTTIAFLLTTAYFARFKMSARNSQVYYDVIDPCAEIKKRLRIQKQILENTQENMDNEKKNLPKEPDGSEDYDKRIANIDELRE